MSSAHHHTHHVGEHNSRRLGVTLTLVTVFLVAEVVGGLASNSLALLADAGHMASDAAALALALWAMRVARRPPSATHTFGYRRAEILASLANGVALLLVSGGIAYEAVQRLGAPPAVQGPMMLAVAAGGLVVNVVSLAVLRGGKSESLNVRAAWLHVVADSLGSAGAIVSGVAVTWLGWRWADPASSLFIVAVVVWSAWSLLRRAGSILMQAVPPDVSLHEVEAALMAIEGVVAARDLHLWSVTDDAAIMSAHLTVAEDAERDGIVDEVAVRMREQFGIRHTTVQLMCGGGATRAHHGCEAHA